MKENIIYIVPIVLFIMLIVYMLLKAGVIPLK